MSFDIALSGINAINTSLDTVSNNIANSGTFGFKSSRANFASVYAGSQPTGAEIASVTQSIDNGGSVLTTGRDMDAAIQGRGFFAARDSSGAIAYTRVGSFTVDKSGYVTDSAGRKLQGYPITPGATTMGGLGDLKVPNGQIAALATSKIRYVGNMSADWPAPVTPTFDPTDPTSFNSSMVSIAYDSLGVQHSVTQYFVTTGAGVDVHYTSDGTLLPTVTKLGFGTDGQLWSVNGATPAAPTPAPANWRPTFAPVPVDLGTPAGANSLTVGIDYNDTTAFAGEATTTVNNTDGYASGVLIGVKLGEDGSVNAQYSNGQKQSVGMVALATFANENALEAVGNTSWSATSASGAALFFMPGTGTAGKLTVGGLEQSNVDIASELVGLMAAQRNYQANSKVISTENQMMQSLMQAL